MEKDERKEESKGHPFIEEDVSLGRDRVYKGYTH